MISLGFTKQIKKIVLKIIDETIGKKFPIIDEITDVFQEQDKRFKELEREISALKTLVKVIVKENNEQTCCCNKKDCCGNDTK